ncbi:MAG: O-antigen ligase family protein [Solirubrobacterales bacterium]
MGTATGTTEALAHRPGRIAVGWRVAPLVAAVAAPVLLSGGFTAGSRSLFIAFAAIAISVALMRDDRSIVALSREPAVVCLLGLAVLAALSSAWTVGDPAEALRWGLVIAAMAAIALVAGQEAGRGGVIALAAVIASLAALEASIGLVSAGLRIEPYAQRIGGSWRPGGTFEYPPALALLQVSALPFVLRAMAGPRRGWAMSGAAGAALAGAAIALSGSRVELALGLAVLALAVCFPARTVGLSSGRAALAVAIPVAAGVAAHLALGGYVWPGAHGGDPGRLLVIAAIPIAGAAAWTLVRASQPGSIRTSGRRAGACALIAAGAAIAIVLAALAFASAGGARPWTEPVSGFTHGRTAEWSAAVATATDRPVGGAGADAYAVASARHQGHDETLYAHDLPLEAWAELGPLGLMLVVGLFGSVGVLVWRIRRHPDAWLVAPAAAAFLLANLVDWPWHLAGSAAVWALALGACLALRR